MRARVQQQTNLVERPRRAVVRHAKEHVVHAEVTNHHRLRRRGSTEGTIRRHTLGFRRRGKDQRRGTRDAFAERRGRRRAFALLLDESVENRVRVKRGRVAGFRSGTATRVSRLRIPRVGAGPDAEYIGAPRLRTRVALSRAAAFARGGPRRRRSEKDTTRVRFGRRRRGGLRRRRRDSRRADATASSFSEIWNLAPDPNPRPNASRRASRGPVPFAFSGNTYAMTRSYISRSTRRSNGWTDTSMWSHMGASGGDAARSACTRNIGVSLRRRAFAFEGLSGSHRESTGRGATTRFAEARLLRPAPRSRALVRGNLERQLRAHELRHAARVRVSLAREGQFGYFRGEERATARAHHPSERIDGEREFYRGSAAIGSNERLRGRHRGRHRGLRVVRRALERGDGGENATRAEGFERGAPRWRFCSSLETSAVSRPPETIRSRPSGERARVRIRRVLPRRHRAPSRHLIRRQRTRDDRGGGALFTLDEGTPLGGEERGGGGGGSRRGIFQLREKHGTDDVHERRELIGVELSLDVGRTQRELRQRLRSTTVHARARERSRARTRRRKTNRRDRRRRRSDRRSRRRVSRARERA